MPRSRPPPTCRRFPPWRTCRSPRRCRSPPRRACRSSRRRRSPEPLPDRRGSRQRRRSGAAAGGQRYARTPMPTSRRSPRRRRRPAGRDLAYGAFQRGLYLTAFDLAIKRAEAGDVAAQTLIGLIYEGGYGVPQSFDRRLHLVQARRRRERPRSAIRAGHDVSPGPRNDRWIAPRRRTISRRRRSQGQIDAMYNLALLHLEGAVRPPDPELRGAIPPDAPRTPAMATPNTPSPSSTAQGLGVDAGRDPRYRLAGRRRRGSASSPRRSNTPSACSTAKASPRTKPPQRSGSNGRPMPATRSPRTGLRESSRSAPACRPLRSTRPSGISSPSNGRQEGRMAGQLRRRPDRRTEDRRRWRPRSDGRPTDACGLKPRRKYGRQALAALRGRRTAWHARRCSTSWSTPSSRPDADWRATSARSRTSRSR